MNYRKEEVQRLIEELYKDKDIGRLNLGTLLTYIGNIHLYENKKIPTIWLLDQGKEYFICPPYCNEEVKYSKEESLFFVNELMTRLQKVKNWLEE